MNNFWFSTPTDIYFGKGQINVLGKILNKSGAKKVLLAYGHGSIKKNGVYNDILKELDFHSIPFVELSGIDPNPRISTVRKGAALCKENDVDYIIAAGAGSVIDCCKAIAAARYYNGDPWDFFIRKASIKKALPICSVLTLAATGSEMNGGTVITNEKTNEKLSTGSMKLKPRFSILDPCYTFTVPKNQTAAGIADIMSHVFEQYFSFPPSTLQDFMAEAVLKTVIKHSPIAINNPEDYEARSQIMWSGTIALNGLLGSGKDGDWATHLIEHEVSAKYDITHGTGLAILTPHWMRKVLDHTTAPKFAQYAKNVWGINDSDLLTASEKGIFKTAEFFTSLGIPSKLSEIGIGNEKFEEMADSALKHNVIGRFRNLSKKDIVEIYKNAL
jgi:butanol dehydrogenase